MSETLSDLKALIEKEIRKITAKNDITPVELENMTKSLCALEKIKEIERMDAGDMEYSGRMVSTMPMGYNDRRFFDENRSYMRGRDARTGRYMSRDFERNHGHDTGYSGHSIRDRMIDKLERMYDEAQTEHERQVVDEWIRRLSDNK